MGSKLNQKKPDTTGSSVIQHIIPQASRNKVSTEYERQANEDDLSRASGKPADDEGQQQENATGKPV
ncbi:hypothetical protein [Undibacterium sp.]|uniref:hypothetical protein n=1 Tax=Undibacterium sp. TaxID=1914977 RepID=UPI00374CBE28